MSSTNSQQPQTLPLPLVREAGHQRLTGLSAAIAAKFGFDAILIRALFTLGALCGGAGALFYLALWLVTPYSTEANVPLDRLFHGWRSWNLKAYLIISAVLSIGIGTWIHFPLNTQPIAVLAVASALVYIYNRVKPHIGRQNSHDGHSSNFVGTDADSLSTITNPNVANSQLGLATSNSRLVKGRVIKKAWPSRLLIIVFSVALTVVSSRFLGSVPLGLTLGLSVIAISMLALSSRGKNGLLVFAGIVFSLATLATTVVTVFGLHYTYHLINAPQPRMSFVAVNEIVKIDVVNLDARRPSEMNVYADTSIVIIHLDKDVDPVINYKIDHSYFESFGDTHLGYAMGSTGMAFGLDPRSAPLEINLESDKSLILVQPS